MTDTEDIKTSGGAEALATPATGEDVAAIGMAADPDMPMAMDSAEAGAGDAPEDFKTSGGAEALATPATGEDVAAIGMAADPDMPMAMDSAEAGAGDAPEDSEVLMDLEDRG